MGTYGGLYICAAGHKRPKIHEKINVCFHGDYSNGLQVGFSLLCVREERPTHLDRERGRDFFLEIQSGSMSRVSDLGPTWTLLLATRLQGARPHRNCDTRP